MIEQRIIVPEGITLEEIQAKIERGARFVVFQYCVSLLAVSLQRLSPAIFIESESEILDKSKKYDTISKVFGWWHVPFLRPLIYGFRFWGPIHTVRCIKQNQKGGIDVTKDILLNLSDDSIQAGVIQINEIAEIFMRPEKSDLKEFEKTLAKDFSHDPNVQEVYAGLFINTDEHASPHLVIGLRVKTNFEDYVQQVLKSLYKRYRKHVFFEIIQLNDDDELTAKLIEQGVKIC